MSPLDGVSEALESGLCDVGTAPSATPARRQRLRLLGITGLRFALHGRQRATVAQDLVLSERGYPAFWLFARHNPLERDYCARPAAGLLHRGHGLPGERGAERRETLTPTAGARQQCRLFEIPTAPIAVRLVRLTLANGETEVLATLLLAEQN